MDKKTAVYLVLAIVIGFFAVAYLRHHIPQLQTVVSAVGLDAPVQQIEDSISSVISGNPQVAVTAVSGAIGAFGILRNNTKGTIQVLKDEKDSVSRELFGANNQIEVLTTQFKEQFEEQTLELQGTQEDLSTLSEAFNKQITVNNQDKQTIIDMKDELHEQAIQISALENTIKDNMVTTSH